MTDSPDLTNSVMPEGDARGRAGDVPEAIRRRYLAERRLDGAIVYFTDTTVVTPSFRDRGIRLIAARSDPATIRDLLLVAQHRGWTGVHVRGAEGFRREAWLQARTLGLEVDGYRPRDRDEQALDRRRQTQTRTAERQQQDQTRERRQSLDLRTSRDRMRVVEAVVRGRTVERSAAAEILDAARRRVAEIERRREADLPGRQHSR